MVRVRIVYSVKFRVRVMCSVRFRVRFRVRVYLASIVWVRLEARFMCR